MFFAVVSLGLEKLAHQEALEKFPHLNIKMIDGGLLIEAPAEAALELNRWLKIPTRILLRLFETRVRDIPKLYKKIKAFDWRPYYLSAPTEIKVSSSNSRLFDDRKISKAVTDGINDFFKATQSKKADILRLEGKTAATLYLRFDQDNVSISIDTSGERLDRRGVRTWVGEAPLRETYAHACLQALVNEFKEDIELCDPMSGSGVFPREALDWNKANDQRSFTCENFLTKSDDSPKTLNNPFHNIYAVESDEKTFKALEHNAQGATLIHGNSLEAIKLPAGLIFVANPPYGIRLKLDNPTAFLNNVVAKFFKYEPKAIALLVPKDIQFKAKHRVLLAFSNGGIAVKLALFRT